MRRRRVRKYLDVEAGEEKEQGSEREIKMMGIGG